MLRPDDYWAYHQDERDHAATMGCFTVLAVLVCGVVLVIAALVG